MWYIFYKVTVINGTLNIQSAFDRSVLKYINAMPNILVSHRRMVRNILGYHMVSYFRKKLFDWLSGKLLKHFTSTAYQSQQSAMCVNNASDFPFYLNIDQIHRYRWIGM